MHTNQSCGNDNVTTTHYHLYMDESGQFEGDSSKVRGSIILGALIKDEAVEAIKEKYSNLLLKYFSGKLQIHSKDFIKQNRTKFMSFSNELLGSLLGRKMKDNIVVFKMDFRTNVNAGDHRYLSDSFAANRYLNMAQDVIEHICFLHSSFWGKSITFSLHPNNRVMSFSSTDEQTVSDFNALGFKTFADKYTPDKMIAYLWDANALRIFCHRLFLEYNAFASTIGSRSYSGIEMPVASKSNDVFVEIVDVLAFILRGFCGDGMREMLTAKIDVKLSYGPEHTRYKSLAQSYLQGEYDIFFQQALQAGKEMSSYYHQQVNSMIRLPLASPGLTMPMISRLEALLDASLRAKTGNWEFVSTVTAKLMAGLAALPPEEQNSVETQRVRARLYAHKLSVHNHRGEVLPALLAAKEIEGVDLGLLGLEDWREQLACRNRQAVAYANAFDFTWGCETLPPLIGVLEQNIQHIQSATGALVRDDLIGRLRGALGQCCAFLAPRFPERFEEAERLFLAAKSQFVRNKDRTFHTINFFHLYNDWGKHEQADSMLQELLSDDANKAFIDAPTKENARYRQFVLNCFFKYSSAKPDLEDLPTSFSIEHLTDYFESSSDEHPFEFIFAYLGRWSARLGKLDLSDAYYARALAIPESGGHELQPTLQAIRAEILAWQAQDLRAHAPERSAENMRKATELIRSLGQDPALSAMLSLTPGAPSGGWFGPAYDALAAVDWSAGFSEQACDELLSCFTFNYK